MAHFNKHKKRLDQAENQPLYFGAVTVLGILIGLGGIWALWHVSTIGYLESIVSSLSYENCQRDARHILAIVQEPIIAISRSYGALMSGQFDYTSLHSGQNIDAIDQFLVQTGQSRYITEIGRAVQQECRDRSRMPSSA
eukprot:TRINITY_DN27676_c0_g1_i2.p1 TRINITY_DN27676_c0_g1~~TRINITY_DN27676_c0_g1_i2.p1  ORF type:complete len:146 (-),score=14.23 TRINITY_DN27676_c0_g1_i2:10-426(-)